MSLIPSALENWHNRHETSLLITELAIRILRSRGYRLMSSSPHCCFFLLVENRNCLKGMAISTMYPLAVIFPALCQIAFQDESLLLFI
jgi:hypothetical protein